MEIFDSSALIIILNMSGWLIVGYLVRDYFQETKKIKELLRETKDQYNQVQINHKLLAQRVDYIEESLAAIADNVDAIKDTLDQRNRELIQELKDEIKNLRNH